MYRDQSRWQEGQAMPIRFHFNWTLGGLWWGRASNGCWCPHLAPPASRLSPAQPPESTMELFCGTWALGGFFWGEGRDVRWDAGFGPPLCLSLSRPLPRHQHFCCLLGTAGCVLPQQTSREYRVNLVKMLRGIQCESCQNVAGNPV